MKLTDAIKMLFGLVLNHSSVLCKISCVPFSKLGKNELVKGICKIAVIIPWVSINISPSGYPFASQFQVIIIVFFDEIFSQLNQ